MDLNNVGSNRKYWDFAFDEIAKYDVKANVLHVKKVSNKEKVIFIGHS